jgi:hypothetical protein
MKAASEEYDEDDSLEDDEIPELAGITDNTCRIAIDLDDDVVLPQDKVGAGFTRKEHLYGGEMLTRWGLIDAVEWLIMTIHEFLLIFLPSRILGWILEVFLRCIICLLWISQSDAFLVDAL